MMQVVRAVLRGHVLTECDCEEERVLLVLVGKPKADWKNMTYTFDGHPLFWFLGEPPFTDNSSPPDLHFTDRQRQREVRYHVSAAIFPLFYFRGTTMRLTVYYRILFVLALFATLALITSSTYARGRSGGRSGGGRSGGGRNLSSKVSGGGSRPGNLSNQAGSLSSRTGGLSSRTGNLNSRLADGNQLQSMLQGKTGERRGNLSERNGQYQQSGQNWANQFQNRSQPFTPTWYASHPNAWQYTHPNAGAAVVASTVAVATWVGSAYAPASSSTTVIYEAVPEETLLPSDNVAYEAPGTAASEEKWLPVGIYALSTTKDAPALLMLQLVVDHQGNLRGVYYDSITDASHNIVGKLDSETQVAQWRLESSEQVTFQASLAELTQPSGEMQVNLPAGPQQWQLARLENAGQ